MSMLPGERQTYILERLNQDGRVLATDIAAKFKVSEDSARRDLRDLAQAGLCKRVYGGALPLSPAATSLAQRQTENRDRKSRLAATTAALVAELLPERGLLFLDVGSTNAAVADVLPLGLGGVVATNAPNIAASLVHRRDLELLLVGGRVDPFVGAALGAHALREVERVRPDVALIGACALDIDAGLSVFDAEDAAMKRTIVAGARHVVAAVTSDKLATRAQFDVAPASRLTHLVVEPDAPDAAVTELRALGIEIRVAGLARKA